MSSRTRWTALAAVVILAAASNSAQAQALLWSLPEDGTWVRYEGTFEQVEIRPNDPDGDLKIDWIRHLYIKSVGRDEAEFRGQTVNCRWIEIKSITGKPSEMGINAGPVGARIYKVLVPESAIAGTPRDSEQIHVAFIPIVKGYRKIGDGEVKPIGANVLQVYPLLSMLMHYKTLELVNPDPIDPVVPWQGNVLAREYKGVYQMESPSSRSVNEAKLYRSDDVPFGLAKWSIEMHREAKDPREPRSSFQRVSEVNVVMSVHEVGTAAESELVVPAELATP